MLLIVLSLSFLANAEECKLLLSDKHELNHPLANMIVNFDSKKPFYHAFRHFEHYKLWQTKLSNKDEINTESLKNWITLGDYKGVFSHRGSQKNLVTNYGKNVAEIYLKEGSVFLNANNVKQVDQLLKAYDVYKSNNPTSTEKWLENEEDNEFFRKKVIHQEQGTQEAYLTRKPKDQVADSLGELLADLDFLKTYNIAGVIHEVRYYDGAFPRFEFTLLNPFVFDHIEFVGEIKRLSPQAYRHFEKEMQEIKLINVTHP